MPYINLFILFSIGVLLIAVGWFQCWLYDKMKCDEMEIVEAVQSITKPYNDNLLKQIEDIKKPIS